MLLIIKKGGRHCQSTIDNNEKSTNDAQTFGLLLYTKTRKGQEKVKKRVKTLLSLDNIIHRRLSFSFQVG